MNVDDMIIVSIDDHLIEPPDMFDAPRAGEVPGPGAQAGARRARARPLGVRGQGRRRWSASTPSCRGRRRSGASTRALIAEMRPGGLRHPRADPRHEPQRRARVDVLPEHARVQRAAGSRRPKDKDLALVMLKAYNDWHIDEWCASYPGRFIPLAIGPVWDMDALVDEVQRVAAKGCRAISMPELPHLQGLPSYQSDYWDPFLTAVSRRGRGHVPAHRPGPRRHQHGPRLLDRQLHGALDPGLGAVRPGPAVGPGDAQVPGAQDRVVRGRHRLDPVPHGPRRPPLPNQRWTGAGLRRQDAERGVPRALAGLLHRRSDVAEARTRRSASTSSPSRPTIPTPTGCGRTRPEYLLAQCDGAGLLRRGHRQDHVAERRPLLQLGPVRRDPARSRPRSARCERSRPTSTPAWSREGVARPVRGRIRRTRWRRV